MSVLCLHWAQDRCYNPLYQELFVNVVLWSDAIVFPKATETM